MPAWCILFSFGLAFVLREIDQRLDERGAVEIFPGDASAARTILQVV